MKILHVVASIASEAAGPSVSVPRLAEAQMRLGADVRIATVADPSEPHPQRTTLPHERFRQSASKVPIFSDLKLSGKMREMLSQKSIPYDVVHSHGLWLAPNVYPALAARNGALWVVSPRGMLGEAAMKFSALKKKIFWSLLQRPALSYSGLIHATSEEEAREVKRMGIKAPVVLAPNGIELPQLKNNSIRRKEILSLGRVHPKKGLDRLVEAWSRIATRHPDWSVVIAGPDEEGHVEELKKLVNRLNVPRVTLMGPLFGEAKQAAYRESSIFVLPTLNENFALTVAEALACELPVISTKGAPWAGLIDHDCGLWIDHGPERMAAALSELIGRGREARAEMGKRGRAWMAEEFSWDEIAHTLLAAYDHNLLR